ncbi:MAG: acyl carrier protein [Thiotrichales bacterium]|nr:MAG: acyl carrier protein [Thiotrichales bacterium]
MTVEDIQNKVAKIIETNLGIDLEKVVPEASFEVDLKADSLEIVEIIMELEDQFSIEIPDEDAKNMKTVQDAIDYIAARVPS